MKGWPMLERFVDWLEEGPLRGITKCLAADAAFLTFGRLAARRYAAAPLPSWEDVLASDGAGRVRNVALTTSCPRYYASFHESLLRSAQRHSPDTLLQFHVIGVSAEQARGLWRVLRERAGAQPVALSWQARPAGLPENVLPAYYQNARYLLARRVLDTWRRPLFVLDIDVQLLAPLARAEKLAGERDVCLTYRPRQCPSRRYLAGFSMFADTEAGRAFLQTYEQLYRRYSGLLFFPKFDQRLLYLGAARTGRAALGRFSFDRIITAVNPRQSEQGRLLYYPKGKAKWAGGTA